MRQRAHRMGGGLSLLVPQPYAALEQAVRVHLTGSPIEVAETVLRIVGDDVLVVEDLHWAHDSTLAALAHLVDRLTLLVTSRPERLDRLRSVLDDRHWVALGPLGADAAARLARARHPDLPAHEQRALLEVAAGNPLLIERLVDDGLAVSPSLQAAMAHRLDDLDDVTRRAISELALLGRPAEPTLLRRSPSTSDLVETLPDGRRRLRHAALSAAVVESLSSETKRAMHAELADLLERATDGAEAAAHAYAAGDFPRARRLATGAAEQCDDPGERAYLHQLAADAAVASGGAADVASVHRSRAAEDHVAAGRLADAIAQAELVDDDVGLHAADAALHRGRAEWFLGDVAEARRQFDRAERLAAGDDDRLVRIANERTFLEVRDHEDGCLERASAAADAADRLGGISALRARSTLGAALLYAGDPRWQPVLRETLADLAEHDAAELESATAFHYVSGLAFHGRLHDAIDVARVQIDRARASGLGSWVTQMEQVWFTHRGVISAGLSTMIADADAHLREHQLLRNRDHVLFGRLLAELDLGRFDDARHTLATMVAESSGTAEERVKIACVRAELAWYVDDLDLAAFALEEGRSAGDAYFGLQTLVERTVAHVFLRHGEPVEPRFPTDAMPMWWSAVHEIQGLAALASNDVPTADAELRCAFEHYRAMGLPRWIARVGMMSRDATTRRTAIDVARRAGLVGVLRRLGVSVHPALTFTEESVLRRIAIGETSREVAAALGITPGTVDQHVESARRKLGAATRFEAAVLVT